MGAVQLPQQSYSGCKQPMQQADMPTAASACMQRQAFVAAGCQTLAAFLQMPSRQPQGTECQSGGARLQVRAQELDSLRVTAMHVSKRKVALPEVGCQGIEHRRCLGLAGQQQHLCHTTAPQEDLQGFG